MKYRIVAAFPFAFVALFLVALSVVHEPASRDVRVRVEIETVKALGLAGCIAAALAFDRGDYMRRAWALQGGCLLMLLVRDLSFAPTIARHPMFMGTTADLVQSALVLV